MTDQFKNFDQGKIRRHPDNPRMASKSFTTKLSVSMAQLGDLSPIIINARNNRIISGHQRDVELVLSACKLDWTLVYDEIQPDGTLAIGYAIQHTTGNRFNIRMVDWDEEVERVALLRANKLQANWDFDKLSTNFEDDELLEGGFEKDDFFSHPLEGSGEEGEEEDIFGEKKNEGTEEESEKEPVFKSCIITLTTTDKEIVRDLEMEVQHLLERYPQVKLDIFIPE